MMKVLICGRKMEKARLLTCPLKLSSGRKSPVKLQKKKLQFF